MKLNVFCLLRTVCVTSVCMMVLGACQSTGKDGKPLTPAQITQEREATLEMAKLGLQSLLKQNPAAQKEMDSAAGYAVFNTTNVNIILLVVARGEGVLFDKRQANPVFMQALKTGEGLGAGYQEQYQIILFKTTSAIDQFLYTSIMGQRGGMDIDANFSAGSGGTIRSFNPNITFYTVGLNGYDLQANYGGTLYLVDQQLNDPVTMQKIEAKSKAMSAAPASK